MCNLLKVKLYATFIAKIKSNMTVFNIYNAAVMIFDMTKS